MNKQGVSAITGVILLVAIVVAIAGIVYVYVSAMTGKEFTGRLELEPDFHFPFVTLTFSDGSKFTFETFNFDEVEALEVDKNYILSYNDFHKTLYNVRDAGVILL